MAAEIAAGMAHIHSLNGIHRDLAVRACIRTHKHTPPRSQETKRGHSILGFVPACFVVFLTHTFAPQGAQRAGRLRLHMQSVRLWHGSCKRTNKTTTRMKQHRAIATTTTATTQFNTIFCFIISKRYELIRIATLTLLICCLVGVAGTA